MALVLVAALSASADAGTTTISLVRELDDTTVIPFIPTPFSALPELRSDDGFAVFLGIQASSGYEGVLHTNATSFTRLVDTFDDVPGEPAAAFIGFTAISIDQLRAAFVGFVSGASWGNAAVYVGFGGAGPVEIARYGGYAGEDRNWFVFSATDIAWDETAGEARVALRASTQPTFLEGIHVVSTDTSVHRIADASTEVPGHPGESFHPTFSNPAITPAGVFFRGATLGETHAGIYRGALDGASIDIVADDETVAPGGTGTFAAFGSSFVRTVLDADGADVAFLATTTDGRSGIWAHVDGELRLVADSNTPAPGGGTLAFLDWPPAIDQGRVTFTALDGDTATLFRWDGTELLPILATGDVVDGRTISNLGTPELDGDVITTRLLFADGGFGLYRAVVLTPDQAPADLDGDGVVAVSDLLALIAAWGPCVGCPEDLDGSGAVDVGDLLVLLGTWGTGSAPENDDLWSARPLTGSAAFSTIGASDSAYPMPTGTEHGIPSLMTLSCDQGYGLDMHDDVWFRWEPPPGHMYSAALCGSVDFDARIVVYACETGTCSESDLIPVGCNDDAPGCDGGAIVHFSGTQGFEPFPTLSFLIRVGSRDPGGAGNGTLMLGVWPEYTDDQQPPYWREGDGFDLPWMPEPWYSYHEDTGPRVPLPATLVGAGDDTPDCGAGDLYDFWISWASPRSGAVRVHTRFNELDGRETTLSVFDPSGAVIACTAGLTTDTTTVYFGAVAGQRYLFRVGFVEPDVPLLSVPQIIIDPLEDYTACGWAYSGDGYFPTPRVPGCSDGACCETVCDIDPYCCGVEWDSQCVALANAHCGKPPGGVCGSPESCFTVHGTGGCADESCCAVVTTLDPFCVDAWDSVCVQLAVDHCATPACPVEGASGSCFEAHADLSGGCEDPDCCGLVCALDPYCAYVWDEACAELAQQWCSPPR